MVREIRMTRREFFKRLPRLFFGIGNDLTTALIKNVPVDTGNLKNKIGFRIIGKRILEIFMPGYALYVEFGTPPHIIRPKTKKALAFEVGRKQRLEAGIPSSKSNRVVVKEVKHPGTMPQPFIRNTFKAELPNIIKNNLIRIYRNG